MHIRYHTGLSKLIGSGPSIERHGGGRGWRGRIELKMASSLGSSRGWLSPDREYEGREVVEVHGLGGEGTAL